LPEALTALADALAPLAKAAGGCAVGAPAQPTPLEGYVAHMLAAGLRVRGLRVQRTERPLFDAAAGAPDFLSAATVQELQAAGAGLAVQTSVSLADGLRVLSCVAYGGTAASKQFSARSPLAVPETLSVLVAGEPGRADASDALWLELLRRILPGEDEALPAQKRLALAEADYLFSSGFWQAAADRLLSLAGASPDWAFARGVMALQLAGQWERAEAAIQGALQRHPDSGPLWALRGWVGLRQKRPEDALMWFEQARLCDMTREGYYRLANGMLALEGGNEDAARRELGRTAQMLPDDAFVQVYVARYHRNRGDLDKAIACYRQAAQSPSPSSETWSELAMVLEATGDRDGALKALQEAFRLDRGNVAVVRHLASLLKRRGRHEEALQATRKAVEARPRSSALLATHGDVAVQMWRLDTAEEAYRAAIAADGESAYATVGLAGVLMLRGQYRQARALLSDLLARQPNCHLARVQLGRLLGELGRTDEAAAVLAEAVTSPDSEVEARLALTDVYLRAGQPQNALSSAQIAAASRPEARTFAALAGAFVQAGELTKAEEAAATAIAKDPASPDAHLAAARVHVASNRLDEALAEGQHALELDPFSVPAFELLGAVHAARGQYALCAEQWRRALALNPWNADLHRRLSEVLGPHLADWTGTRDHHNKYVELEQARAEASR
jgi:tetratricopeptide (TPR) repeat protein